MIYKELEPHLIKFYKTPRAEIKIRSLKMMISKDGLTEPIVVTEKINAETGATEYFILDGLKRFFACKDLGYTKIPAIVVKHPLNNEKDFAYWHAILNQVEPYHIDEKIGIFDIFLMNSALTIPEKEFILGLEEGEFVMLDEVLQFKAQNAEYQDKVFSKLLKGRTTIKTAHKNIAKYEEEESKEIPEGAEGLVSSDEDMNSGDMYMNGEPPIPFNIFSELRVRDNNTCQSCLRQEEQLSQVFRGYRILPDYINRDKILDKDNLVLMCPTCVKGIKMHAMGRMLINESTIYPNFLKYSNILKQAITDSGRPLSVFLTIEEQRGLFD